MVKDAPDGVEEFAHDGNDRLLGFLAALEESLITGFNVFVALDRDQGRHEEGGTQMHVAGLTKAARLMHRGAASKGPGIEPAWATHCGALSPLAGRQFSQDAQATLIRDSGTGSEQLSGWASRHCCAELQGFLFQATMRRCRCAR